jgi:putative Holliday junction resolvase
MAKLIALDIGGKRTGVAETDFMQIIAQAVETVPTDQLLSYLKKRFEKEAYEALVVGDPKDLKGEDSHNSALVRALCVKIQAHFPQLPLHMVDERFTSKMAMNRLIDSGMRKSQRREKGSLDAESAAVILESYLSSR